MAPPPRATAAATLAGNRGTGTAGQHQRPRDGERGWQPPLQHQRRRRRRAARLHLVSQGGRQRVPQSVVVVQEVFAVVRDGDCCCRVWSFPIC